MPDNENLKVLLHLLRETQLDWLAGEVGSAILEARQSYNQVHPNEELPLFERKIARGWTDAAERPQDTI